MKKDNAENEESAMIKVGKIVSAVGIRGEVKVYPYTDYPERISELERVCAEGRWLQIEKVRYQKNMPIVKFSGIDDRNAAEAARGKYLTIDKKDARQLEEDEYYIFDLIGLEARDPQGVLLGTVSDVIQNTAQDLYEIEARDGKKYLIPAVHEFITDIDLKHGIMTVKPIEGLFGDQEEV